MAALQNIDPEVLKSFSKAIQAQADKLQKIFVPFQDTFKKLAKVLQDVPESTKILAEYGWYLPLDFHPPTINCYADKLKKGNYELVSNEMVALFDNDIADIELNLIKKFPNRKAPIQAAIRAHNNQEYFLSIPVFFSQIEGICKELTGIRFYKIKNDQPLTSSWIKNFKSDSIIELVLEPLKHTGVTRQKQDLSNPLGINRHDVLHGDSVDYGENKVNSYKVLSLLNYIGETVYMAKQRIDEKEKNTT